MFTFIISSNFSYLAGESPSAMPAATTTAPQTPYPASPTGVPIVPPQYYPQFSDIPIAYEANSQKLLAPVEAILMVVNSKETRATLALMKPINGRTKLVQTTTNGVTFTVGRFGMYYVALIKTSPGTEGPNAATEKLERALAVVKPGFVISVGVCFGKNKNKLKFADIIVANVINDYLYRRLGEEKDVIRSPQPAVGARLLDIFDQTAGFKLLRAAGDPVLVKIDPLVSGPNLIDNVDVKNKLFEYFPDAEGGEMEGAGILSAVRAIPGNRPEAIIIKAIVDWADGTKGKEWQPFAAHAAASYVLYHMKTNKF